MTRWPQVMLDIETFGKRPNAPIVQIGLCAFDIHEGTIGPVQRINVTPDFDITPPDFETVKWWMRQGHEARLSVTDDDAVHTSVAVATVIEFFNFIVMDKAELWAMPPSFDVVILENLIGTCGRKMPWHYAATRDLRTLEAIASGDKAQRIKASIPHDAACDARAQAETAIMYMKRIRAAIEAQRT